MPHRLAWVVQEGEEETGTRLVLMKLPGGEPVILEGSSALIWLLAIEGADVPGALAELVCRPESEIGQDTEAFLSDLVARGLLVVDAAN